MKRALATLAALGLLSTTSIAGTVFDDLKTSAPRTVFDDINTSAPRTIFDSLRDAAPRSNGVFGDIAKAAP